MTKKARRVYVGQILDKQDSSKTYNESQEGMLYNDNNQGIRVQTEGADREFLTDTQTQDVKNKSLDNSNAIVVKDTNLEIQKSSNSAHKVHFSVSSVSTSQIFSFPDTTGELVTKNFAQTFTNKTIDADNNTISNLETDNLKSGILNTSLSGGATDLQLPSAKASKDYADSVSGSVSTALSNHLNDTVDAHLGTAIGNTPSGNLAATTVQAALNELQSDIDTREVAANKGAANGYCPLGADSKVSATYLPSYVDDVIEVANFAALPVTGETGKIYVTLDTNLTYRWSGSAYVEISQSLALGETSVTAYRGDRGATAYTHSQATSATHGISGSFVGTTDTQVLTNKDIDGGTASDAKRITVPKDTLTNLTALTRKEGTIVYATDTDKLYTDDGVNLSAIGAGGVGNPNVYSLLKSDEDTATWSTGNNAAFLGGGSISGTFTKQSASSPLNGTYSYVFTQAAGSLNDYLASDVQAVPIRSRGVTNRTNLVYTYDGATNDIRFIVYDVTNSTIVTSSANYVENSTVGKQVELIYDLPSTCTQVRFGIQIAVANNGKVLKFDDIQMSDSPFSVANLVITEGVTYTGYTSKDGSNRILYKTKDTTRSNESVLVSVTNSGYTKYTILKKCNVSLTASQSQGSIGSALETAHYNVGGTLIKSSASNNSTATSNGSSLTTVADIGDYFISLANSTVPTDVTSTNFSITATALSSNIIQSWNDGTDWTSLTYTQVNALTGNQGLGTFTAGGVEWRRDGGDLLYKGKLTCGTTAASEARIPFPSGLVSANTTIIPSIQIAGLFSLNQSNSTYFGGNILIEPSVGYFTIGLQGSTYNSQTKATGTAVASLGQIISFEARVPIAGWSSKPQLIGLPTATQTEYYIEAAGNAGQSITANVTDIPFIATTQNNATWSGSSFTAPITGNYEICGSYYLAVGASVYTYLYVGGSVAKCVGNGVSGSIQPFSGKIYLTAGQVLTIRSSGSFTLANSSTNHTLSITRLNGKNDGVYVGQLSGQWQYDLTVTGTSWTTSRAVGFVYKGDNGNYRMRFNIKGTVPSSSRTSYTVSVTGATFKSGHDQLVGANVDGSAASTCFALVGNNTSNIVATHTSFTGTIYFFTGDVELESKPTFAVSTP